MPLGILFWVLYLVAMIFSFWANYTPGNWRPVGSSLLIWVLIGILGWSVFGPAVR